MSGDFGDVKYKMPQGIKGTNLFWLLQYGEHLLMRNISKKKEETWGLIQANKEGNHKEVLPEGSRE